MATDLTASLPTTSLPTTPLALPPGTLDVFDPRGGDAVGEASGRDALPVVMIHGLVMDHTLYSGVTYALLPDFHCIVPVLPSAVTVAPCPRPPTSR